jgi:hypothetical protein
MISCVHESVCLIARVFVWCMSVGCGWEIGISMQVGVCYCKGYRADGRGFWFSERMHE